MIAFLHHCPEAQNNNKAYDKKLSQKYRPRLMSVLSMPFPKLLLKDSYI